MPMKSTDGLPMDNDPLGKLERENALLRIDLEWQTGRQEFLFRGNEPTPLMFIAPIAAGVAVFLVTFFLASQPGANSGVLVFVGGSAALLMAGIGGTYGYYKYTTFQRARSAYLQRRTAIEQGASTTSPIL